MARRRKLPLLVLVVIGMGLVLWAMWVTGFFEAAGSRTGLEEYINRYAPWSQAIFFALQLVAVVLAPIPNNLTAVVGAHLFGLWTAFRVSLAAMTIGSLLVFGLARGLGQDFVSRVAGERLYGKYIEVIRRKRGIFLAIAFLFPFFPDDLLCILAGLTDIRFRWFVLLVVAFRPWGLLVSCVVGSSAAHIPMEVVVLLAAIGIIFAVLALKYGDRVEEALFKRFGWKR